MDDSDCVGWMCIGSTIIEEINYLGTSINLINLGPYVHIIASIYIKMKSWAYLQATLYVWFDFNLICMFLP